MTFDELLAENTAVRVQMTTLMAQLSAVQASNKELAQELARLKRQTFGVKSERRHVDDKQTGLFAQPEPEAAPARPHAWPPRTVVVAVRARAHHLHRPRSPRHRRPWPHAPALGRVS